MVALALSPAGLLGESRWLEVDEAGDDGAGEERVLGKSLKEGAVASDCIGEPAVCELVSVAGISIA